MVREFSDYVQPNMALSNGSIDANLFQHSLYFNKFTADKGLKLTKLLTVPIALLFANGLPRGRPK
ncbi:D-methionine-binding lipoprotein MetQ precursor [compost metagenome]